MLAISFPKPSSMLRQAFKELDTLAYGSDAEKAALGDPQALARPWDPSSVVNPRLRQQLWEWLDRVVVWVNHEYGWRPEDLIPECWPQHPALVREIAVLADLRRRAGAAATSDGMEEWHRYALPAFLDRMNRRASASSCGEKHQDWPARGPYTRHISDGSRSGRAQYFTADVEAITQRHALAQERQDRERAAAAPLPEPPNDGAGLRLVDDDEHGTVDTRTGELLP
ncbi:hypothetical protein ON003_00520 [Janibacter hoylei]|uniref:hypothetical protein n=1 Tax=Janibacter hoylei TaxID=364298 RepID=UPI002237511A|nr:hypothetical protein [Janibacter hoylei]MCW4600267.1 hypothetical protein [Janibacter hoylei]